MIVFFQRGSGLSGGRLFSLELLMLIAACAPITTAAGQQVGVSLKLHGVTIPNNSFVDLDDVLYRAPDREDFNEPPTNARTHLHDGALLCVTDLVDCCDTPRTVHGDWYYPDGSTVSNDSIIITPNGGRHEFLVNRGPNEIINGRQFYGSVRLFRRWSSPPQRGRFGCELPSAADPNATQILYANIVNFGTAFNTSQVTLSPSGPGIAGNSFTLRCSATLISPLPLPSNVPSPSFEWFYGPHANASLPSGVTPTATVRMGDDIYSSTLLFFPTLSDSHAGNYTCKLGAGRLINSTVVSADDVVGEVTASGPPVLGQGGYTLICDVQVANRFHPYITTYQWTKNNSSVTELEVGTGIESNSLSFSSLRLSDAGRYTCRATVHSFRTNDDITVMTSHNVKIQISGSTSVMCKSATPNPVRPIGSAVNLTCVVHVELGPAVDVPVIVSTVLTGPNGFTANNISQPISGISSSMYIITSRAVISSFERSQSGVYTCTARLNASSSSRPYLIDSDTTSVGSIQVTTGVYLILRDHFIANNTQINIRNIGQYSDNPNGALQCITDRKPCCFNPKYGEWYLPNGTLVSKQLFATESDMEFYRNRENNGRVYLNRRTITATTPVGQFCCEVPDTTNVNQTLCVFIDRISVKISGPPIAGESYFLECSAGESATTFQWLILPQGTTVVNSSSVTIISNSSTSQLKFRPLQQSHNGSYSCRTTTNESTLLSQEIEIHAKVPSVSIQINESTSGRSVAGESFIFSCMLLGAGNLNPSVTYRWTKNTSGGHMQAGAESILFFTTVRLSDAANYSCIADITSTYLTGIITAIGSCSMTVQIPPSSISLTSNEANNIQILGSDVMLTCTVKLNSAIVASEIFLLKENAQLFKDGNLLALDGPRVSDTTIIYTAHLNSFQRSDFGNYTCSATIRPQPSSTYITGIDALSDMIVIKPVIPPPLNLRAIQSNSSAPVEVCWSPPTLQGAFNITGYRIFYGNGQTANVSVPTAVTSIGLRVEGEYIHQWVFIRSESDQLSSELVNITVESVGFCSLHGMGIRRSCSREIGATAGVMVIIMAIIGIITVVIILLWRKRSFGTKDVPVSVNTAYKDVAVDHKKELYYENLDDMMITESTQQQPDNEPVAASTTDPTASEHISTMFIEANITH